MKYTSSRACQSRTWNNTEQLLRSSRVLGKHHGAVFDLLLRTGLLVHWRVAQTWNILDRRGVLQDPTPNLRCSEAPTRCVKSLQVGKCEIMYSLMFYEDSYICIYSHAVKIFCIPEPHRRYPDKMQLHFYASFLCHLTGIQAHIWFNFTTEQQNMKEINMTTGIQMLLVQTEFLLFICISDIKGKNNNNILTPAPGIQFSAVGWSKCLINVSLSVRQEKVLVLDRLQSSGKY